MKNLNYTKNSDDIELKIKKLENSFVEISWLFLNKTQNKEREGYIGLEDYKRNFFKASYTFKPL